MSSNQTPQPPLTPIRDTANSNSKQMLKRAWWILLLNFFIPGSAQIVAGNRKLGRVGIVFTLGFWVFLVLSILFALVSKVALFTILITPWIAYPLGVLFIIYSTLIVVLSFDALRIMHLAQVGRGAMRLTLVSLLLVTSVSAFLTGTIGSTTFTATSFMSHIFTKSGSLEQHKGRYNILLMGGDSGTDRFGLRPDSMSVLSISATTGNAVNIGLPRNLTHIQFLSDTPIHSAFPNGFDHDCGGTCMLNAIYKATTDNYPSLYPDAKKNSTTGGVEATKSAIEWVTGLKIDAYVLINMKNFAGLIDALGGIDVNVKKALPIGGQIDCTPANNIHLSNCPDAMGWIEVGQQHMDGRTALWYARSRHNTNDYDRMKRQREVENIVLKKVDLTTLLFKFGAVAGASSNLVKSDIPSGSIPTLLDLAFKAKGKGLKSLQLTAPLIDASNPDFFLMRHLIAQKLRTYN